MRRTIWPIAACLAALAVATAGTIASSSARHSHLASSVREESSVIPVPRKDLPAQPRLLWQATTDTSVNENGPFTIDGVVIRSTDHSVVAVEPDTGSERWRYERTDATLCALSLGFSAVIATFETGIGCGETVSINAVTGRYVATRLAQAPTDHAHDPVREIRSLDAVGLMNSRRIELWRSDLVRTVSVGTPNSPQEPYELSDATCRISSALTRTSTLAVIDRCDGVPASGGARLRLLKCVPKDSRKPEDIVSIDLPNPESRIVAIAKMAVAVYVPAPEAEVNDGELVVYSRSGEEMSRVPFPRLEPTDEILNADLAHHITVYTPHGLYLLHPDSLKILDVLPEATGTPAALDSDHYIYPTVRGISVYDWARRCEVSVMPLEMRPGTARLAVAGDAIVVRQGDTVTAYGD